MTERELTVVAFETRDECSGLVSTQDGRRLSYARGYGPGERKPLVLLADVMAAVDDARQEPDPRAALEYLFTLCSCAYEEM